MRRLGFVVLGLVLTAGMAPGQTGPAGGKGGGQPPQDSRLAKPKTLNDKDFSFTPPQTKEEWEKRRQQVKEQVLIANGLWPMPHRTPLNAVVHGKINRG